MYAKVHLKDMKVTDDIIVKITVSACVWWTGMIKFRNRENISDPCSTMTPCNPPVICTTCQLSFTVLLHPALSYFSCIAGSLRICLFHFPTANVAILTTHHHSSLSRFLQNKWIEDLSCSWPDEICSPSSWLMGPLCSLAPVFFSDHPSPFLPLYGHCFSSCLSSFNKPCLASTQTSARHSLLLSLPTTQFPEKHVAVSLSHRLPVCSIYPLPSLTHHIISWAPLLWSSQTV